MPAATVLLLASSTRMNEPVCAVLQVRVHEQRLRRRAAGSRPISLSESSVAVLVAVQRVDVDPVVDRLDHHPRPAGRVLDVRTCARP